MIDPESIPLFTGDLGELERHIDALRVEADGIRKAGGEAHRQFQGLSACYEAPEAEQLFASTAPVRDAADAYADKVSGVVSALSAYAVEVGPIAKRLEALQKKAYGFVAGLKTEGGEIDENWAEDEDKVTEHNELLHEVNVARAQFYAAEIACHNKITALVGGTQYALNTGAKQFRPLGAELYGASAEVLDQAEELPWGTPVTQDRDWWDPDDLGYYAKGVLWDGFVVDGAWGTVEGVWTLVNPLGGEESAQARESLLRAVVGAETYLMEAGGQEPTGVFASEFAQGSKVYAKEFAKGFVAWDQWKENPARAAGLVSFNFLTLGWGGPLKAATAGRAGTAAKIASTVVKVEQVIDPISAAAKVTGYVAPKLADVTASLRGTNAIPELTGPRSVLELSDGSKLVIEDGRFIAYDRHGEVVAEAPRQEPSLAEGTVPARERELAGVGAGTHEASGSHTPESGGAGTVAHGHGGAGSGGSGGANGTNGGGPGWPSEPPRPSFMRDGPNPYGPRGNLTREQIEEIQVYRANHEPGYLKHFYRKNGTRLSLSLYDESGYTPPQLVQLPDNGPWIRAKDVPEPPRPYYLDEKYIREGADTVTDAARLKKLNDAALRRHLAIQWDNLVRKWKAEAGAAHQQYGTDETYVDWAEAGGTYKESHTQMVELAEEFGETAARSHYMAEKGPGFVEQRLLGPKNGNHQFDQVWKHDDGRIVVIEAKSSPDTELGIRTLPNGKQVYQGSREYFEDILAAMAKRGERDLVRAMDKALQEGKLEYVVVHGERNSGTYTGYRYRRFDISRGTLP
ncbi:hypothetical protein Stsp02_54810 [Streptomyces sp. NBRC 14336]|uniref:hypothetical protein n=1 Tax=Streptomyces sp. NBRC 14336 TaxID=3030992 RepID=UPI0024A18E0D|nr:hypothetical protein [Streptomyces sp. NBRC 14336]WBO78856.1 hypothetical protein SBE_002494 [Streptomyces sp. SBE_14.2]GLW49820.1 hypothetical protein Stsp02_54810 [Streptomyces sp. NBRC 14336]